MRSELRQVLDGMAWAADAVRKWAFVTIAIVISFYITAILSGCKATCAVVDIVHSGCAVLRYHDQLGQEREVVVTHEEVDALGRDVAARRADAGAP
jgi:hypothetical protein